MSYGIDSTIIWKMLKYFCWEFFRNLFRHFLHKSICAIYAFTLELLSSRVVIGSQELMSRNIISGQTMIHSAISFGISPSSIWEFLRLFRWKYIWPWPCFFRNFLRHSIWNSFSNLFHKFFGHFWKMPSDLF